MQMSPRRDIRMEGAQKWDASLSRQGSASRGSRVLSDGGSSTSAKSTVPARRCRAEVQSAARGRGRTKPESEPPLTDESSANREDDSWAQEFEEAGESDLLNLSADDPDGLKRGKVDWLLYNEVQKMQARAVVNGLYGTADQAGLCIMTANRTVQGPASTPRVSTNRRRCIR
jgi:hypothetical protein